jgi:ABC-type glycerol-3-phosphate transport system substrate-binding protein
MKPFHATLLGIFVALAIGSVAILAGFTNEGEQSVGAVVIWGSLPDSVVQGQLDEVRYLRNDFSDVSYVRVSIERFMPALIEAIAANRGPDLVVFPASFLVLHGDKLQDIPYSTMSQRTFKDTFIEGGEIFLGDTSFKGFPFVVDPLVLYWNRTIFTAAGVANPPKYWDEVASLAIKLTKADKNGTLIQSAIALGSWDNVSNAKGIILSILRELGDRVVVRQGAGFANAFGSLAQNSVSPAVSAFRFYTEFANPAKPAYSWNRSQPSSHDAFLAGRLALYVGRASELYQLREANPNLNFDIAPLPEARGAGKFTESDLYALAIPRGSKNPSGALFAAEALSGAPAQKVLAQKSRIPSVRRDLLVVSPDDPYSEIFRTAALSAFAFLDPDPAKTEALFQRAVENISSGKLEISEAVAGAGQELKAILKVQ